MSASSLQDARGGLTRIAYAYALFPIWTRSCLPSVLGLLLRLRIHASMSSLSRPASAVSSSFVAVAAAPCAASLPRSAGSRKTRKGLDGLGMVAPPVVLELEAVLAREANRLGWKGIGGTWGIDLGSRLEGGADAESFASTFGSVGPMGSAEGSSRKPTLALWRRARRRATREKRWTMTRLMPNCVSTEWLSKVLPEGSNHQLSRSVSISGSSPSGRHENVSYMLRISRNIFGG